jgi:SCP1.201-like deaminase
MAGIGEVAEGLHRVLAILDTAIHHARQSELLCGDASQIWHEATDGSVSDEVGEVSQSWRLTADRTSEVIHCLIAAHNRVSRYLDKLTGTGCASPVAAEPGGPVCDVRPVHERQPDKVREVQRRVGRGTRGSQARGAWLKPNGEVEDVRSGEDTPWFTETERVLRELGGVQGQRLARLAVHIEVQFLVRMKGRKANETLILDRDPCGVPPDKPLPFTCDSQLGNLIRNLLEPGSTLTVVDPDGRLWKYPKEKKR